MNEILIVEDDMHISALLKEALQKEGYCCTQAFSGTEARLLLTMNRYALVLLDLMLPGISGEDVLQEIRRQGQTPVIVLTAKDTIDVKVEFLKKGADDYVTKPFDIKEVLARIEVQLRKSTKEIQKTKISYQGMVLDKDTHQVFIDERELPKITKQEFSILELLLKHPKKYLVRKKFSNMRGKRYIWERQKRWMYTSAISAKR